MIFDIGNPNMPRGNALFYQYVRGKNPFFPGYRIIASNVVISLLPSDKDAQIASFPPVGIDDYETLKEMAERENTDLIKMPDFEMPENKALQPSYLNNRVNDFNDAVSEYFKRYRSRRQFSNAQMDAYQQLNYFGQLAMEVRSIIERHGSLPQIERYIKQMNSIKAHIKNKAYYKEISRIIEIVQSENENVTKLIDLYMRLIVAVHKEEYSDAAALEKEIKTLEGELTV